MPSDPLVSLIVLNWNGRQHLAYCLPSLLATDYTPYEIIVVDNASTDNSVAFVRENFPNVRVMVNERNLGFSAGMNVGLRATQGEIVVLLNNDIEVRPGWLHALVHAMTSDETVGIAGCKVYYPDGETLQHVGATLNYPLMTSHHYGYQEQDRGQHDEMRQVDYVTGAALAIKREVLDRIGYLDEGFFLYYDDPDLCYRARQAGYKVLCVPQAVILHHETATNVKGSYFTLCHYHRSRLRFFLKHHTTQQFLDDFVPHEMARLKEPTSTENLVAARRGYLETMLTLPELLQSRVSPSERERVRKALEDLREAALRRRITVYGSKPEEWYRQELTDRQVLQEPGFYSAVPVVGPLIAKFRETWNNVSTKWYVRLILQQQVAFNRLATAVLNDLGSQAGANADDVFWLASELAEMNRRSEETVSHLLDEMNDLRERLERIEDSLEREGSSKAGGGIVEIETD